MTQQNQGGTPPPRPDDLWIISFIEKAIAFGTKHWKVLVPSSVGVITLLVLISYYPSFAVTLVFVAAGGYGLLKMIKKDSLIPFLQRRWWALLLSALVLMVVAQPLYILYAGWVTHDWEKQLNPPALYYTWVVHEEDFDMKDQTKLPRWNPEIEKNHHLRNSILLAARSVGVEADIMQPLDLSVIESGEPFAVVLFESLTYQVDVIVPGEGDNPATTKKERKTVLATYFVVPKEQVIPMGDAGDETIPQTWVMPQGEFFAPVIAEELNPSFAFFQAGFANAAGHRLSFEKLQELLEKAALGQPITGIVLEGEGGG